MGSHRRRDVPELCTSGSHRRRDELRTSTQIDFSSRSIDVVSRNNFRKAALFMDYVNAVFACQLAKALAATGADTRKQFILQLQEISPVSEGRQKTAHYAMAFCGGDTVASKINLAVSAADAVNMIVQWVLAVHPNATFTGIQINDNARAAPHQDQNNVGYSFSISLGPFFGGLLWPQPQP